MSRRIALGLEYDGGPWHGWQAQRDPRCVTVQETLESALSQVANEAVRTVCAGRTDSGVHASAQVVHFDTTAQRTARAWTLGANSQLPAGIAVQWAVEVAPEFHARFSAVTRSYRYLILNRPQRSALLAGRVCFEHRPLDAARMHRSAQSLLGERDFSSFRGAGCQSRTPMRRIESIRVDRLDQMVIFDVCANAFLLHMVRNIAGALLRVGTARAGIDWPGQLLEVRDRRLGAATAPAAGLYLSGVAYDPVWGLPESPPAPLLKL